MRIQHNISALNAHRNLGANNTQASKNLEKLSSGFKINRAGDDAAGLAISEKMRGQIRGLDMATKNSQDAISLIQTAEGALNETHSILQRMRELAVQSSSDTNVNLDRDAIQQEITQLTEELDRISETTEFNTQKLLDGSFSGTFQIGANEGQELKMDIDKMGAAALGLVNTTTIAKDVAESSTTGAKLADGTYTINAAGNKLLDAKGNEVGAVAAGVITGTNGAEYKFTTSASLASGTLTIKDGKATAQTTLNSASSKLSAGKYEVVGTQVIKDGKVVGEMVGTGATAALTFKQGDGTTLSISKADLNLADDLQAGSTFEINGVSVSTRDQASGTITKIDNAITKVSDQRSALGAVQNRLEHTINNLGAASENLTAAESRIRDTDMAKEMMEFTKNNILMQAAQSMLAQANQQPQGVLQLLG
ncbi:flagellin N-terminal helical domain-containing protein [Lysinibacillus capsici]|uniref:flagellin N-terminal helical domain-containing protein n=1 Tax=Lysinibacillus capsici TaxID=2115968 RepID=UPI001CDA4973|nr:flagellin [Lysinibacillus capsici]